jgi:hypothetical protein
MRNRWPLLLVVGVVAIGAALLLTRSDEDGAGRYANLTAERLPPEAVLWQRVGEFGSDDAPGWIVNGTLRTDGERLVVFDRRDGTALREIDPADGSEVGQVTLERSAIDLVPAPDGTFYGLLETGASVIGHFDADGALIERLGSREDVDRPGGIDLGPDGELLVMDVERGRMLVYDPAGEILHDWAFESQARETPGFAVGADGTVIIYERNGHVFAVGVDIYSIDGERIASDVGGGVDVEGVTGSTPAGPVDAGAAGDIYFASRVEVYRLAAAGETLLRFGGFNPTAVDEPFDPGEFAAIRSTVVMPDESIVIIDMNEVSWQLIRVAFE